MTELATSTYYRRSTKVVEKNENFITYQNSDYFVSSRILFK